MAKRQRIFTSVQKEFHPGDVVVSTAVITDRDTYGALYLHAVPGTIGVVLDGDSLPTFPNVRWAGEGGVCNVPAGQLTRYEGPRYDVDG